MQWIFVIEEYGMNICYIPWPNNVVANALTKLPMIDNTDKKHLFAKVTEDFVGKHAWSHGIMSVRYNGNCTGAERTRKLTYNRTVSKPKEMILSIWNNLWKMKLTRTIHNLPAKISTQT